MDGITLKKKYVKRTNQLVSKMKMFRLQLQQSRGYMKPS